ncbi:MAG: hypothetical protein AAB367_02195 [Patescibacteria group bacterium]
MIETKRIHGGLTGLMIGSILGIIITVIAFSCFVCGFLLSLSSFFSPQTLLTPFFNGTAYYDSFTRYILSSFALYSILGFLFGFIIGKKSPPDKTLKRIFYVALAIIVLSSIFVPPEL